ncbi:hypothetical protein F5Y18DRAFT_420863 [Xylariaceae sp. FL1019]|nr:hypothetical protein F5Y18DRAFT_420863 [Xylariaceae sp. FL1019]
MSPASQKKRASQDSKDTTGVGDSTDTRHSRPPPNRRREKPQLSCNLCRRRKLRCDRQHPCSNCKARDEYASIFSSCTYVTGLPTSPSASVQDRLRRLEDLVVSYIGVDSSALSPLPSVTPAQDKSLASSDFGSLKRSCTETKYQDQTHWGSVLDAISELKEDVGDTADSPPSQGTAIPTTSSVDSPLLYGCKPVTKDELLAALPSREIVDALVSDYFEVLEIPSCALNQVEFVKQIRSFWQNPQETPVMWLGLLFSILAISSYLQDYEATGMDNGRCGLDYPFLGSVFCEKTAQCLLLGQYTRCGPFVCETLMHYLTAECARRRDTNNELWLILSSTAHLAMRMGYHRDPSHFESFSPYEGEMRRRLWAIIYHLDTCMSGQLGVPRLINDAFCDTELPRNLLDSDFSPASSQLPPSRPDTEITPTLIALSKIRIGRLYTMVTNTVTSTQGSTYARILQIDRDIEEAFSAIPLCCRIHSLSDSASDSPVIFLQKILIQTTYYKAQIVLHWRYLTMAKKEDQYSYSKKVTISAALKIVELSHAICEGLNTRGRLFAVRWRILSILHSDSFFLATSVLCFYLSQYRDTISAPELDEITRCLRETKRIWDIRGRSSAEAQQAATAIQTIFPGTIDFNTDETSSGSWISTQSDNDEQAGFRGNQGMQTSSVPLLAFTLITACPDPFTGGMMPFFDSMFEGGPMFRPQTNESLIDSFLTGNMDLWFQLWTIALEESEYQQHSSSANNKCTITGDVCKLCM